MLVASQRSHTAQNTSDKKGSRDSSTLSIGYGPNRSALALVDVADEKREGADEDLFGRGAALAGHARAVDREPVVAEAEEQRVRRQRQRVACEALGGPPGPLGQRALHAAAGGFEASLDDVELVDLARADAQAPHVVGRA